MVRARLGETPRAAHSRFVGLLMARLAEATGVDAESWRVVGLVHDLDYFAVEGDWSRHGRLAAEWLEGRLEAEALVAIAAHDHRSGVTSDSALAAGLRLADALAVLDQAGGRERVVAALRAGDLAEVAGERVYLGLIIVRLADRLGVGIAELGVMLAGLPEQAAEL